MATTSPSRCIEISTPDWQHLTRHALIALFCTSLVVLSLAAVLSRLIPMTGSQGYIIRSGSMEPTIPVGSLVAVRAIPVSQIVPGDIVTLRTTTDVVITHRVTETVRTTDGSIELTTKGDANEFSDIARWPEPSIVGRVDFWVPFIGYVLAFASTGAGMLALLAGMGALLLIIGSLDRAEARHRRWRRVPHETTTSG